LTRPTLIGTTDAGNMTEFLSGRTGRTEISPRLSLSLIFPKPRLTHSSFFQDALKDRTAPANCQ
jgi:hypothetical protein